MKFFSFEASFSSKSALGISVYESLFINSARSRRASSRTHEEKKKDERSERGGWGGRRKRRAEERNERDPEEDERRRKKGRGRNAEGKFLLYRLINGGR